MATTKLQFRPRARMVAVLGEHLISDQAVGLIELVKNSYDADATEVTVEITGLDDHATTTVTVRDNGCGMSLEDITGKWLSPATGHKDQAKRGGRRTALGRLPLGEKGVGRFAVHQIGKTLELVTKSEGHPELVLCVDWDLFDAEDQFLDGVTIEVTERVQPVEFTGGQTGTRLVIRHSRALWTEKLLQKVHQTLRRLQSPLREDDSRFKLVFRCPSNPKYENIDPSDILERAHYEFRVLVDPSGDCDFEYKTSHPGLAGRSQSGTANLAQMAKNDLQGPTPTCGPFWMNLYVWDRTSNFLQLSGVSRDELNAMCGVSLFRDHMRVLPYGELGNDWLFLDQERINSPTERLANNQIIGCVQLDQSENLLLRDKTNREGLIENDAFLDLRALVRAAIRLFTSYWKTDRPRKKIPPPVDPRTIDKARVVAGAIRVSADPSIPVAIPVVPGNSSLADAPKADGAPSSPPEGVTPPGNVSAPEGVRVVTQLEAVDQLIESINGVEAFIGDREEQLDSMLHLAATGLAAERVVHEFGRQVQGAVEALAGVRPLLRPDDRTGPAISALGTALTTLRNEFRVLAPYEVVRPAEPRRDTSVKEACELALGLNRAPLAEAKIEWGLDGKDFVVKVRPASLVQVIDNLVHNACHWVGTLQEGKPRRVGVVLAADEERILVADSGPGIPGESAPHIFDLFFTMRAHGRGLGLYISKEVVRSMKGRLRLAGPEDMRLVPAWATGAVFVVDFAKTTRTGGVGQPGDSNHGA
jgi:signal transduction histidine kinase